MLRTVGWVRRGAAALQHVSIQDNRKQKETEIKVESSTILEHSTSLINMLPSAGWGGILSRGRDGRCGIGEGSGGQAFQRVYDTDSGRGG